MPVLGMKGRPAGDVWFTTAELGLVDALAVEAVDGCPFLEGRQAFGFQCGGGHEQLAGLLVPEPVFPAKVLGLLRARLAEAGLQAVRGVVDTRVDDAAVVPGLVRGQRVRSLQHDQGRAGILTQQLIGRCQSHDAAAHHAVIRMLHA